MGKVEFGREAVWRVLLRLGNGMNLALSGSKGLGSGV